MLKICCCLLPDYLLTGQTYRFELHDLGNRPVFDIHAGNGSVVLTESLLLRDAAINHYNITVTAVNAGQ